MNSPPSIDAWRSLSVADRLALVEQIWDSIANEREAATISDELKAELDRRVADPNSAANAISWDELKARVMGS